MAIKFHRDTALPASPTAADDGFWFIRPAPTDPYKHYILDGGDVFEIDAVSNQQFIDALLLKADDNTVVKLTGAQSIDGVKTFNSQVVVPAGTSSNRAINKGQLDSAVSTLTQAINDIETTLATGLHVPTDIDCSTNPNYPTSTKGDSYIVTAAGKIGGASGTPVDVGDMIVCKADSGGGTEAQVGSNFFIVESNILDATTSIKGKIQIATQAEVNAGSVSNKAVVPSTLQAKINAFETTLTNTFNSRYLRYDQSQTLTGAQKTTARDNIGAADDSKVVHNTGAETVAGKKTFSTVPASSQDAATGNDLVRKSQMDTAIDNAELEWTTDTW